MNSRYIYNDIPIEVTTEFPFCKKRIKVKRHKNKRINKKWNKQFGKKYRCITPGDIFLTDASAMFGLPQLIIMDSITFNRLKKLNEFREVE